jgi:hypothetical protein
MKLFLPLILAAAISVPECKLPPAPPNPSPTATATPEASPSASPSPSPAPSPTPLPTAFPAPTSAATATPTESCVLEASDGQCENNPATAASYADAVRSAQNEAREANLVFGDKIAIPEKEYTAWIARKLRSNGYCARNGLDDEVWVKKTNVFSEHFDIVTSEGFIWLKFAALCKPSKF